MNLDDDEYPISDEICSICGSNSDEVEISMGVCEFCAVHDIVHCSICEETFDIVERHHFYINLCVPCSFCMIDYD